MIRVKICEFQEIKYIIKYPPAYTEGKKYPVLFFLHGAGTRGTDIDRLIHNPFFETTNQYTCFPFIVIAPLCYTDTWFDIFEKVIGLLEYASSEIYTDKNRIYGIGTSMGGYGIWQLAMSRPEVFAAIIPICGGGMYWNAVRLKNIGVWAFHGQKDTVVFPEESERMVDAINKCGGKAILTVYPQNTHDAWTDTYENTEVFKWLLTQKKGNNGIVRTEYNDSEVFG